MPAFVRCDSTNYSFPKGTLNKLKNKNLKLKSFPAILLNGWLRGWLNGSLSLVEGMKSH